MACKISQIFMIKIYISTKLIKRAIRNCNSLAGYNFGNHNLDIKGSIPFFFKKMYIKTFLAQ